MALASAPRTASRFSPSSLMTTSIASAALAVAGAVAVTAGSYMPWATFYAGLVERNGVPGHGKYFIALAAASLVAAGLSHIRGMSPLRLLPAIAGATIAVFAVRDLMNIRALIDDPAAAFYAPGAGDGLYVVVAGAALLVASALVSPGVTRPSRADATLGAIAPLAVATAFIVAIAALIAGGYGEYYLHLASGGHQHGHTEASNPAHVLTGAGAALLIAAGSAGMYLLGRRR